MKEDLQIEQASRLADQNAPEDISTERARAFVARTLESGRAAEGRRSLLGSFFHERPVLAWGGSAFAVMAAAAIALALVLPSNNVATEAILMPGIESTHATSAVADTTITAPADTAEAFQIPVSE